MVSLPAEMCPMLTEAIAYKAYRNYRKNKYKCQ